MPWARKGSFDLVGKANIHRRQGMRTLPSAAVWITSILLALILVLVGLSKLEGPSAKRWNDRFSHWGYPSGSPYVVGVIEILGGVALLVPRSRRAAAGILTTVMAGAVCTHLMNAEFPRIISPVVLGSLAFLLYCSAPSVKRITGAANKRAAGSGP